MAHRKAMIAGHKVTCRCVACKALRKRRGKGKKGKGKAGHSAAHTRAQHKRKVRELRHELGEVKRGARSASSKGDAGSWSKFTARKSRIERSIAALKR